MRCGLCRSERGFSLIELMTVVVVIGILASVAYPAYTDHIQRSRIAEATSTLSEMRIQQERFFQDNRSFANAAGNCGLTIPANNSFSYACVVNAAGYVATANGLAGMAGFSFVVNQDNQRWTTGFPSAVAPLPLNCWITRRGDRC